MQKQYKIANSRNKCNFLNVTPSKREMERSSKGKSQKSTKIIIKEDENVN